MSEIFKESNSKVIKPTRDITVSVANELKAKLRQIVKEGATGVTINLNAVEKIDPFGLSVLIAAHNSLQKNGERLQLINTSKDIAKLLAKLQLTLHFEVN